MELHPVPAGRPAPDLAGATLLLPAVAFANIGELAVDVLVASSGAQLVGRLDSQQLLACVGNNAYQLQPPGLLATALELYQVPGTKLLLLQQRAPAIPGRQRAFAEELAAWALRARIAQLLLLCGLDGQHRREAQLEGPQLRYLAPAAAAGSSGSSGGDAATQPSGSELGAACRELGLLALELEVAETEQQLHGLLPPWPLLEALQQQRLPHALLATFAAEGDNLGDGMLLAATAAELLRARGLLPAAAAAAAAEAGSSSTCGGAGLRAPCSWRGLYGRSFDRSLF